MSHCKASAHCAVVNADALPSTLENALPKHSRVGNSDSFGTPTTLFCRSPRLMLSMICPSVRFCTALVSSTAAPMASQEQHIHRSIPKLAMQQPAPLPCIVSHHAAEHALTLAGPHTEGKVAIQFDQQTTIPTIWHICKETMQSVTVSLSPQRVCHHSFSVKVCLSLTTQCVVSNLQINQHGMAGSR